MKIVLSKFIKCFFVLSIVSQSGHVFSQTDIDCFTLTKSDIRAQRYKGNRRVAVSLTFDDGLLEHYTEVFPRLKELGIKATFWLCGEKIEAGNFKGTPTMTWEMAREMAQAGMEMSNHGWSHTSIDKLDDKGIIREAERNDSIILANTGIKPVTFCYPFNKHNAHSDSLLSVGRIGLRTKQVSLGGKQYEKQGGNLIALYEKAKANGEWMVTMTHGITTGYDNIAADTTALWEFIRYIAADDDCWIAPFCEVKEYLNGSVRCDTTSSRQDIIINDGWTIKLMSKPQRDVVAAAEL